MSKLVQVVLTIEAADLTAAALRDATNSEDIAAADAETLYDLARLFQVASEEPQRFPLTGKKATSLARKVRVGAKGPAQPQGRKNKRKARQEKRIGWAKQRRKLRAEMAEQYNAAVATMEAEREEMEMAHAEWVAKVQDQPKFDIFGSDGSRLLGGVPESMIRPVEAPEAEAPEIILP